MSTIPSPSSTIPDATPASSTVGRKLRWVGLAAFLFFLIKGLLWLALPAILVWWQTTAGS